MELQLLIDSCSRCFICKKPATKPPPDPETVDWHFLVRLARRHRVQGLAWQGLSDMQLDIPADCANALRAEAAQVVATNLRIASEAGELLRQFERAKIPLLFLKGLSLGALVYRNPLLKMGWDIDLLVEPDAAGAAARLLIYKGYVLRLPEIEPQSRSFAVWHRQTKESVWWRPEDDLHLELHTRVADNPAMIPALDVHARSQDMEILPGIILPTFAIDELFAYLTVHGASSAWFRLKWIADFAALLAPLDPERIESLHRKSQDLRAGRAAAQALLLADQVFGVPIGEPLRAELRRDRINRLLTASAYRQLLHVREPTERKFGTASIHLTQVALMPGLGFGLGEIKRQIRRTLSH